MSKELRALEELKNGLFGHCKSSYLKDDEKLLNDTLKTYEEMFNDIKSALERKKKLEKVWEIVKTKRVNIEQLTKSKDVYEYNRKMSYWCEEFVDYQMYILTETEYNLLKEMLK